MAKDIKQASEPTSVAQAKPAQPDDPQKVVEDGSGNTKLPGEIRTSKKRG